MQKIIAGIRDASSPETLKLDASYDVEATPPGLYARERLNPQPSDDPNDPAAILIQVSLLAALGGLNTAAINPAYSKLGASLGVNKITASYQTTVCIAINGIGPWLWIPLANKYGRRPIYLFATLLGFGSILGCAYTNTFGQLIAARIFDGFFPVAFALGAATVVDLFFYHQRGRAIGIFTIMMTNGSHLAPIVGGLIGQYLGWRWIFKFAAIADAVMFVVAFFCLPETLYIHIYAASQALLALSGVEPSCQPVCYTVAQDGQISLGLVSCIILRSMYDFASILPAVTVASIFEEFFHWDTLVIGLAYGGALTTGGCLGECAAGWVVDLIVKREREKTGKDPEPEVRLKAIWTGESLVPTGLLIFGFCLQYHTIWVAPILGMGIACFGLQVITTCTYTYAIDCYRTEGSEVAQLFNFIRQEFGFTFAFYVVRMGTAIGYQWTFFVLCTCRGYFSLHFHAWTDVERYRMEEETGEAPQC